MIIFYSLGQVVWLSSGSCCRNQGRLPSSDIGGAGEVSTRGFSVLLIEKRGVENVFSLVTAAIEGKEPKGVIWN